MTPEELVNDFKKIDKGQHAKLVGHIDGEENLAKFQNHLIDTKPDIADLATAVARRRIEIGKAQREKDAAIRQLFSMY
jgi:hypothetical protein